MYIYFFIIFLFCNGNCFLQTYHLFSKSNFDINKYICKDQWDCSYPYVCCNFSFIKVCCKDKTKQLQPSHIPNNSNYNSNYIVKDNT